MIAAVLVHVASFAAVESVVLYTDRAQVTRAAEAKCTANEASVVFPSIPAAAQSQTLSAEGENGIDVVGLRRVTRIARDGEDPRATELRSKLEDLDEKLGDVQRKSDALLQRRRLIDAQMSSAELKMRRELATDNASISQWQTLLDRTRKERDAATKTATALSETTAKLQNERNAVHREFDALGTQRNQQVTDITVVARCSRSATIRLSYVVSGATWLPSYDLYVDERGKDALKLNAVIRQTTGEDWRGVKLQVSTASPREGSEAPRLAPMHVAARDKPESKVIVEATEDRSRLSLGSEPPPPPTADGLALLLDADGKAEIASNGHDHWIQLARFSFDAALDYVAVPKLSPYVFRVATFTSPAPYALLPGALNSFLNGDYVGTSRLDKTPPGKPVECTFGVEEGVELVRTSAYRPDEVKGWFTKDKVLKRGYRYTVRNGTRQEIKLRLRENYPVSKTEKLAVKVDDKQSTKGKLDEERGIAEWVLRAKPGGDAKAQFFFSVTLPEDWEVR